MSPFCAKVVSYAKNSPGTNLQTLTPAALKAKYTGYKSATKTLLSIAPRSIKPDLEKVFTFDNALFAALQKAGWSFSKVPPATLKSWAVEGPALKPSSDKVISYFDKTCGSEVSAAVSPTSPERRARESPSRASGSAS